jgi:ubiquinone/menaquinone biosynthesis C-methylase UbiE
MRFIYRFDDGKNTDKVIEFKKNLPFLTNEDISSYYELRRRAKSANRPMDLNSKCMELIVEQIREISGEDQIKILDAGGGRLYLAKLIYEKTGNHVTALDMQKPRDLFEGVVFIVGDIKQMPFKNKQFDVVLCTHVLEHIRDPKDAIRELLRVTKRKLIVIMPRQREYLYSNDLHINYCPYLYNFINFIGLKEAHYQELGGDFVCVADFEV